MGESNKGTAFVKRFFSTGSRDSTDTHDQYLESQGFYRKHSPPDSTSLFRAVSEQVNGVQTLHENVRRYCVEYMRNNYEQFANRIGSNFDSYLANMSQTTTHGSMLELEALAKYYDANVAIFEPFAPARWMIQSSTAKYTWRIFYGKSKRFDSVFTIEYIEKAAYWQAVVYEILYKNVFKLPDVEFAVERMLYDPKGMTTSYNRDKKGRDYFVTADGRQFLFNSRDDTNCVLSNYQYCHFHNSENFPHVRRLFADSNSGRNVQLDGRNHANPLLISRNVSCVRQLLSYNITPFPFKVAKSLDPNIYRNIDFDCWLDSIKLAMRNDTPLKAGMKCIGRINGCLKICQIECILPDKKNCIILLDSVNKLLRVRLETLTPLHFTPKAGKRKQMTPSTNKMEVVNRPNSTQNPGMNLVSSTLEGLHTTLSAQQTTYGEGVCSTLMMPLSSAERQFTFAQLAHPVDAEVTPLVEYGQNHPTMDAADNQQFQHHRPTMAQVLFHTLQPQQPYLEPLKMHQNQEILQQQSHHQLQQVQQTFPAISYNHYGNMQVCNYMNEMVLPINAIQPQLPVMCYETYPPMPVLYAAPPGYVQGQCVYMEPPINAIQPQLPIMNFEMVPFTSSLGYVDGVIQHPASVTDRSVTSVQMMPFTLDSENSVPTSPLNIAKPPLK